MYCITDMNHRAGMMCEILNLHFNQYLQLTVIMTFNFPFSLDLEGYRNGIDYYISSRHLLNCGGGGINVLSSQI